jgi:hypothetical protein
MTRTQRTIVLHWRGLAVVCAIVALFGVSLVLWHRIDSQDREQDLRYAAATKEADLRGTAVSTLAGDVRALRQQVKAGGETPVAPDPTKAVANLPARAEVPVPIPGPPGPSGPAGKAAPTITPSPGPTGPAGADGADSTVPGPAGPQGAPGADSTVPGPQGPQGERGDSGSPGSPPAGWTFTYNGVEYTCSPASGFDESNPRYDCNSDEPEPSPNAPPARQNLALDPSRRVY